MRDAEQHRAGRAVQRYGALRSDSQAAAEVSDVGQMDVPCPFCRALHFRGETVGKSCCHQGKVTLPPLAPYPPELEELMVGVSLEAKNFQKHIRCYNGSMAFASMGAQVEAPPGTGPYCFRIHGQVYHRTGALHPPAGQPHKFAQLYILDSSAANAARMAVGENAGCLPEIMAKLDAVIRQINPFATAYRQMWQVEQEEEERARVEERPPREIVMRICRNDASDQRRYNAPTADEVAVIFVGRDGRVPDNRDIAVYPHGETLTRISPLSANCDPMVYPLLFPAGDPGWTTGLLHDEEHRTRVRQQVTCLQFYSFRLAVRPGAFSPIHAAGKLTQQYIVDSYVRVEAHRMAFLRQNQDQLRVDLYQGLLDHVAAMGDVRGVRIGTVRVLPATYPGSPRALQQNYQDAMSIVRAFGRPDLFITFTCNPRWAEIKASLLPHQRAADRPDVVARVFNLKLAQFLDDVVRRRIFGTVVAHVHVVEFQKRGLPHAHMLFILADRDKPRDADAIDQIVSAEIPDAAADPVLHDLVRRHMIHGPCGSLNPASPCMVNGDCQKLFPKEPRPSTLASVNGYPEYRRSGGRTANVGRHTVDSRWVVPYNAYLLRRYDAHINVEICASVKSVKYLFKYVYKGHDRANVELQQPAHDEYDEISQFLDARYVSPPEAVWRLFEFRLHNQSHTVFRLPIHLPNFQSVFFVEGREREALQQAEGRRTMLEAYFDLNRDDPNARALLYQDIPRHYVLKGNQWVPRQRGGATTIGRMCMVSPKDEGRYFLRVLLAHVPGAQSDEELRTVDGRVCATHREAAQLRGLLADDTEWAACLSEAAGLQMPAQLRQLFVTILAFSEPSDPRALWEAYKADLCEDFARRVDSEAAENAALRSIEAGLAHHRMSCRGCGLPEPGAVDLEVEELTHQLSEQQEGEDMRQRLNAEQRVAVELVLAALDGGPGSERYFFLDGPGGTGKTFVYNTLVHLVQGRGGRVITVASTGIAATLLAGGRTAHSRFQIPVPTLNDSVCPVTANSREADELRQAALIIWDEASMAHAYSVEVVDRLLRDLTCTNAPFAGKVVVLGGDFRQTLPVVRRATRGEIVSASVKSSALWPLFRTVRLVQNMRAAAGEQDFAAWLLQLGEGRLPQGADGLIELPADCLHRGDLVKEVFERALRGEEPLSGCVILSPKNAESLAMNEEVLQMLPGEAKTYVSVDGFEKDSDEVQNTYPLEFLHSLTPTGMPPHLLNLKVGAVVMLLRNLDTRRGLCNGTRLVVRSMWNHTVEAEMLLGEHAGTRVLIPKITLTPSDLPDLPFKLRRRQLPLRVGFAMTINKSQGQTFERVGLYLPEPVFTHGQLYVAFSRVRSLNQIKVQLKQGAKRTANIVYSEVL